MKCYQCGKILRSKWNHCPNCGKCVQMYSKKEYMMKLSDSAQANRIEDMLKSLSTLLNKGT